MNDTNQSAPSGAPPIIHPRAVFTVEQARVVLGLADTTLDREIRLGRLRCSMRGGRRWVLGSWLLAWLEGGEVQRRKRHRASANANGSASAN